MALRQRALAHGMRLSEYGLFREDAGRSSRAGDPLAGEAVASDGGRGVRRARPRLDPARAARGPRRDRRGRSGDVAAPPHRRRPAGRPADALDVRDGRATIEEMARRLRGARLRLHGDHRPQQALRGRRRPRRRAAAAAVRARSTRLQRGSEIRLLRGLEIDILADGTLDLKTTRSPGSTSSWSRSTRRSTCRRASRPGASCARCAPAGHAFAHPTGRHRLLRAAAFDMRRILRWRASRVSLEVNASPERLDLDDLRWRAALEVGERVTIADAHSPANSTSCASASTRRGAPGPERPTWRTRGRWPGS